MLRYIKFLGAYIAFWLSYFVIGKLIFLAYEYQYSKVLNFGEIVTAIGLGLRMDMSMTGYILALIGALSILFFWKISIFKKASTILTMILLIVFSFIQITNLELYRNWGFHIDHTPLQYLNTPKEMFAIGTWKIIILLLAVAFEFWIFKFAYDNLIKPLADNLQNISWKLSPLLALIAALTFIPIRGSFSTAALNTGMVYFSDKQIANHLGVNCIWNFIYNLNKYTVLTNSVNIMPTEQAYSTVEEMTSTSETYTQVLNTKQPNIILVILESFTAYGMKELKGTKGVMPTMSRISKDGILFSNLIANGKRTDKGLVAIFSGFPAQPINSIMKFSQKTERLPFFTKELKKNNYHLSFAYGGDINFTNINSYLKNAGFENIVSQDDFDENQRNSKWGVHDEYMLEYAFENIRQTQQPFLQAVLTLSSHEPYDMPAPFYNYTEDEELNKFYSSIHYADSCLGIFYDKLKKSKLWDNTLMILVADHASQFPDYFADNDAEKYRIPMIWTGGALNCKDTVIDKYISQVDISKSLLQQLDLPNDSFSYSKNIFADTLTEFGFFSYNWGFGYVKDSLTFVYDQTSDKNIVVNGILPPHDSLYAKAYWQAFNDDFVKR